MKFELSLRQEEKVLKWVQSHSITAFSVGSPSCGDEFFQALGCRYDLERFGVTWETDVRKADLLVVSCVITHKSAPELIALYQQMLIPKWVMAVGACACSGGIFQSDRSYSVQPGVAELLPVDVFVPGCPPRPEALLYGILQLQNKIMGKHGKSAVGLENR